MTQTQPVASVQTDLESQIDMLLSDQTLSDGQLAGELTMLARKNREAFIGLAPRWLWRLYERDAKFFQTFILDHKPPSKSALFDDLLKRAEADGHTEFFQRLYAHTEPERFEADVLALARSALTDDELLAALQRRRAYTYRPLTEPAALALFRRHHTKFAEFIRSSLPNDKKGGFETLLDEVAKARGNLRIAARKRDKASGELEMLFSTLFRRVATPEAYYTLLREAFKRKLDDDHIKRIMSSFKPDQWHELPEDLIKAILDRFGEWGDTYLRQNIHSYAERVVSGVMDHLRRLPLGTIHSTPPSREADQMMAGLQTNLGWYMFRQTAPSWAPALYETFPELLETRYISQMYGASGPLLDNLFSRAKADGRYTMFRSLLRMFGLPQPWNADLQEVAARADLTDAQFRRELERLDVPNYSLTLTDQTATMLYKRAPKLTRDFIWRHLGYYRNHHDGLLEAVRASGDMPYYQMLFRRVASGKAWAEQIERVLASDIPPDQIAAELDKWHTAAQADADPAIMRRFLDKYGAAVLPYMERAMNWITENRLRSLLALDIDRGALLRELSAIAGRQTAEFQAMAHIWAPELYKRSPDFFGGFLVRYLDRRQEYVIRQLLPMLARDGRDKLYADLYARFVNEDEWRADLRKLVERTPDDAQLARELALRDVRNMQITDQVAAALYRRDAARFGPFIRAHISAGWRWRGGAENFNALRKLADARGDAEMVNLLRQENPNRREWLELARELLSDGAPPGQTIAEALETIHPKREWDVRSTGIVIDFLNRYRAEVAPYVLAHIHWIHRNTNGAQLLYAIKDAGDEAAYWKAFFAVATPADWAKILRELAQTATPNQFFAGLLYLTPDLPPSQFRWQRWTVDAETALLIYQRFGPRARPFLETFLTEPDLAFYRAVAEQAQAAPDAEQFLDYVTFRLVLKCTLLANNAFPNSTYRQASKAAEDELKAIGEAVIARFDALHAASPERYVRHAAAVLSRFRAFEINRWNDPDDKNPLWNYLSTMHGPAWVASRVGITELLESPSIHVQIIALHFLTPHRSKARPFDGKAVDPVLGAHIAQRVMENLLPLRAFLLTNARPNTKRLALHAFETAGAHGKAALIMPVLSDLADYRAKGAISDDILMTYAKLKRHVQA
jgi:hypothetical protein